MNCTELRTRILSLQAQIHQIGQKIDELKKKPRTTEIQEEINTLEDEKFNLEKEATYLNAQYKKNCR